MTSYVGCEMFYDDRLVGSGHSFHVYHGYRNQLMALDTQIPVLSKLLFQL